MEFHTWPYQIKVLNIDDDAGNFISALYGSHPARRSTLDPTNQLLCSNGSRHEDAHPTIPALPRAHGPRRPRRPAAEADGRGRRGGGRHS